MSEVVVTASAWIAGEPAVSYQIGHDLEEFVWTMLAEACVTDADGKPVSKLPKKAWRVHVTDAAGTTGHIQPVSVAEIVPPLQTLEAGFYLLTLGTFGAPPWVAPAACGIAVYGTPGGTKLEVRGQVVVPVQFVGPTAVHLLTTPVF
jgi:hypothetical protein